MCRSRRELSNEYLLAKCFGFDTAEKAKVAKADVPAPDGEEDRRVFVSDILNKIPKACWTSSKGRDLLEASMAEVSQM